MSTIAPNGQIRFLSGVPLDDTYENTLYFENIGAQTAYFLGLTPIHQMTKCTRVRDGVIKVDALADNLLTADYLMFQNTNFSNKWFYAFIKNIRYVNNSTTEITYVLDDIQTWMFDVTLRQCLIERQHTVSDNINEHLIPEDIGAPEMTKVTHLHTEGFTGDMTAVLFTSAKMESGNWQTAPVTCINGLLTMTEPSVKAIKYMENGTVMSTHWVALEAVINDLISSNFDDSIIGGVCMPDEFCSTTENAQTKEKDTYISKSQLYSGLDGYTPKNKKLYSSPYICVRFQFSDGQCIFLQPQWISGNYIAWKEIDVTSMSPEITIIPKNYKGQSVAYEENITFNRFPQFAVAIDGYKAWVATGALATKELQLQQTTEAGQLEKSMAGTKGFIGTLKGAGKVATGSISAYYTGGMMGGEQISEGLTEAGDAIIDAEFTRMKVEQTIKFANENFDLQHAIAKTLPPSLRGTNIGSSLASAGEIGYTVDKLSINAQTAQSIDDYFTMYGYKLNTIGVPNTNARPHYTYVKTCGCKVVGGAPSDAITRIKAIYDQGIRFWKFANEVGDYSVDNSPI